MGRLIRFFAYLIAYFFTAMISARIIASTHTYDPAWAAFVSFVVYGIPCIIVGITITAILLKKRVKLHYELIVAIIIVVIMALLFSTLIHKSGLPGESWEYNEELTELYTSSQLIKYDQYRVYLGKNVAQGREAAVYRYVDGWGEWELTETGIEKDGKLFINDWRVYPTEFVGVSHIGKNPYTAGQAVYIDNNLDNLTTEPDNAFYLKDDSGNILSNLSNYTATIGDILAVFGEWENGPVGSCTHCDYLIVDRIEVVETLS